MKDTDYGMLLCVSMYISLVKSCLSCSVLYNKTSLADQLSVTVSNLMYYLLDGYMCYL